MLELSFCRLYAYAFMQSFSELEQTRLIHYNTGINVKSDTNELDIKRILSTTVTITKHSSIYSSGLHVESTLFGESLSKE